MDVCRSQEIHFFENKLIIHSQGPQKTKDSKFYKGIEFPLCYIQIMDRTIYSQTISEVRENDTLFDSRYTHLTEQELHSNWFSEQRTYSKAVLSTWGLNLGEMSYSRDNQQILRCILQLITYRQKDLQFRSKVKDDIASLSFERDKYRSFMQQAQRSLQEVTRRLGKSQNECAQMKNRQKKGQVTSKKQKEEDKKMIAMLRAKNQQIMHQIKKKEAEVLRIKEQMKKSVGEKTMSAKNSFEVFENFSPNKKQNNKQQETKYTFLMERNEKEMTQIVRENTILRQKLFEIRQQLLNFNEWIDKQLFGETDNDHFKRNTRFPFNHNLLFKKESLRDQLADLLETAKDGIRQLRELCKGDVNFSQKKSLSSRVLPNKEDIEELNFKKKLKKIDSIKSDRPKQTQTEEIRQYRQTNSKKPSFGKALGEASENVTPKSSMKNVVQELQSYKTSTPKKLGKIDSNIVKKGRINLQSNKPPFQDQLLSDVGDGQESSIVSHIQVQKLGKNRFEKWDILYNDDE